MHLYHRICHSIFSLFTFSLSKENKKKSYFTFSWINSDSSTYNDIHNHGHNSSEKRNTIPTVRLTHPPCHPALMYTWFATQVICNTRRFSFQLCYEILDHLYTPTVGFSSIQIWTILGAMSTCIPKGVSSRIDPTVYAYAHTVVHPFSP